MLKAVYNTIASEGHNKASVQTHAVQSESDLPVGMNMQNLHQHHREVHLKMRMLGLSSSKEDSEK